MLNFQSDYIIIWKIFFYDGILWLIFKNLNTIFKFDFVIGTLVVRMLMLPLVIKAQQNAAKMNNNLPGMQVLQMKMTEARQSGNQLEGKLDLICYK